MVSKKIKCLFIIVTVLTLFCGDASKEANTVVIHTDDTSRILGEIEYSMGGSGGFTGKMKAKPAGPIVVRIFREISPSYANDLKEAGFNVKEGGAYFWKKGNPQTELKYIRDVDLSLDNRELASQFGVTLNR